MLASKVSTPVSDPVCTESPDPYELRDAAASLLTARQHEVLTYMRYEWSQPRIAQFLRISLATVERDVKAIKEAMRTAAVMMDKQKAEGKPRIGLTIQQGRRKAAWRADLTAQGVAPTESSNWPAHMIPNDRYDR